MSERIVNSALWITIMSLVFVGAGAALLIGYVSLYQLAAMQWKAGVVGVGIAGVCVGVTLKLARHRQDLV